MPEVLDTAGSPSAAAPIRVVAGHRPWLWLARGWDDALRSNSVSFAWSALFVVAGGAAIGGLAALGAYEAILPLAAGFPLVAPILVVGLYEVSRRIEAGEAVDIMTPLAAWRRNAGQIGIFGFVLGFVFLAWMRTATLLFAWFFGTSPFTGVEEFVRQAVISGTNIAFLVVGSVIGVVFAALVFTISVVSVPMLLDRETSVFSAMAASWAAVRANPRPMLLWAVLIVLFTTAGLALALIGLIVTLPLVAHATWHAYRDLVPSEVT
jgi:uncharacterized membrane protein